MIVDFHAHILPQIDDGSRSLEESIDLLEMEAEQGIVRVVVTPHFYAQHDSPDRFFARRENAMACLLEEVSKYPSLPKISCGAEVYYFSGMSGSEILKELTIDDSKYILIEMPMPPWTSQMYEELYRIHSRQGLTPIIAHVDRYIGPFRDYGIPRRLEELPVYVQANAAFFLHRSTERMAMRLLKEDRIHLLGSDCHNLTDRAPNLGKAVQRIEQKLGKNAVKRIHLYEDDILHSYN